MTALREQYQKLAPELGKELGMTNALETPHLTKIVVNVGMGAAGEDKSLKELVLDSLRKITGQQPVVTSARQSIAGFKLREGMEIGAKVTLRGARMEDLFYRLVHIVLPRVRDFRGLSPQAFDGHGNYSLGITDHTVFPEISFDDVVKSHSLQITIVTSTEDDQEAQALLTKLQFPFIKDAKV